MANKATTTQNVDERKLTGLVRLRVTVVGRTPMLMDPMTEQQLDDLASRTKRGKRPDVSVQEEAAGKVYRENGGGSPVALPALNFFACLINAGRHVVYTGRSKLSTKEDSIVPSFLDVLDEHIKLTDGNSGVPDWVIDKRRGVNPQGGQTCRIIRPRFDRWGFTTDLEFDADEGIGLEVVRNLVKTAGRKAGLGSFRPSRKGRFGKFDLVKLEVVGPSNGNGAEPPEAN